MNSIIDLITQALFTITIIIIGVEGVMSLLDRLGFLPKYLERFYIARDKRTIDLTLRELGVDNTRPFIRQAIDYWRSDILTTHIDIRGSLFSFIISSTRKIGTEVGLYKKVRLQYYIDLAEPTTDWDSLQTLAEIMCANIRKSLSSLEQLIQIDKIAAPPGNPALAVVIAAQMRKPFVYVNPVSPLSSDPISGKISRNDCVILVHDVALTGQRLADVATALRNAGAIVEHTFVLVERIDSKKFGEETPSETLAKNGITLHPIYAIDDDDLEGMMKRKYFNE